MQLRALQQPHQGKLSGISSGCCEGSSIGALAGVASGVSIGSSTGGDAGASPGLSSGTSSGVSTEGSGERGFSGMNFTGTAKGCAEPTRQRMLPFQGYPYARDKTFVGKRSVRSEV